MDADLRALERRFEETRDPRDGAALLAAQMRAGALAPETARLRAYTGDAAARLVFPDPSPKRVAPRDALREALEHFEQSYGVVEHRLFEPQGPLESVDAHELVARETAREELPAAPWATDDDRASIGRPGVTTGKRIDLAELLGECFDLARRQVLFWAPSGLVPAAEAMEGRRGAAGWGGSVDAGYAYAFTQPPYGLKLDLVARHELFVAVWEGLAGTWEPEGVVIFEWTTEHWRTFDAGREWWGARLWTVAPRDGRPWVGIAASATD